MATSTSCCTTSPASCHCVVTVNPVGIGSIIWTILRPGFSLTHVMRSSLIQLCDPFGTDDLSVLVVNRLDRRLDPQQQFFQQGLSSFRILLHVLNVQVNLAFRNMH